MNFFFKKRETPPAQPPQAAGFSGGLPQQGDALPAALKAHSQFIKLINCPQCGAPKTIPSTTAYLYCDYCGSLMDYDFRMANADTNAGLTNTVYHRIIASVQSPLMMAIARGDRDECRRLYRQVFAEWIRECPQAVSPRARKDAAFREQLVAYMAECAVVKDLDPRQAAMNSQMGLLSASLQRLPTPGGAWMVAGPFWQMADLFKQQMEMTYALIHELGVDQMDPDHAPLAVALHMEYSAFCQGWLPHLSGADGEKLLRLYGLQSGYQELAGPLQLEQRKCGACGSTLHTLPGARQVVCESCGYSIDVASQPVACRKCGSLLSFPAGANQLACPACGTETRRV